MQFSVVLPTRGGERPALLENQLRQLDRMSVKCSDINVIDYPPKNTPDLIERVQQGICQAKHDIIFIIEDDDYYPKDYFEKLLGPFKKVDAVGVNETIYLNINHFGSARMRHKTMSSLFCTAFRKKALDKFTWPDPEEVFLDKILWKYFAKKRINRALFAWKSVKTIGIKHNTGVVGGLGHTKYGYKNFGYGYKYLNMMDRQSKQFYLQYGRKKEKN